MIPRSVLDIAGAVQTSALWGRLWQGLCDLAHGAAMILLLSTIPFGMLVCLFWEAL